MDLSKSEEYDSNLGWGPPMPPVLLRQYRAVLPPDPVRLGVPGVQNHPAVALAS